MLAYSNFLLFQPRYAQNEDQENGDRTSIANIHEQGMQWIPNVASTLAKIPFFSDKSNSTVGLQKILSLLESEDPNVRLHAVKVVANLAAEGHFYSLYNHPYYKRLKNT